MNTIPLSRFARRFEIANRSLPPLNTIPLDVDEPSAEFPIRFFSTIDRLASSSSTLTPGGCRSPGR